MSDGIKRRDFLKVLGASGAGASLVGCSTDDVEKLIPYVVQPEEITPGVATWYTSVCGECSAGCGVWVKTREGRAIKVEGNPIHPVSQGALCARGHSSLQGLYDPDRYSGPMVREGGSLRPISWDEAETLLSERLGSASGRIMAVTGRLGPTMGDLFDNFMAAIGGSRVEFELLSEAPLREATRIAYGRNVVPTYDLERARMILSFGADFLETWLSPVEHQRGFARMSSVDERGSKGTMVFLGSRLSLTGQNADEWFPIRPGTEAAVALAMAHVIARNGGDAGPYHPVLEAYTPDAVAGEAGVDAHAIEELAERFAEAGPSLALGPGLAGHHANATAANLAVLILNHVAGNVGRTVHLRQADRGAAAGPYTDLQGALNRMASGAVDVVLFHGANPAYALPHDAPLEQAMEQVGFKVSFASRPDETSAMADLILPDSHFLESWGDSNPRPGVYALQQPVMQPVPHFDSKETGDVLLSVATRLGHALGGATFYEYLRARAESIYNEMGLGSDFDGFWREVLKDGVFLLPSPEDQPELLRSPDAALSFDAPGFTGDDRAFFLQVYPSSRLADGRFANRPWLQELPDPVSKITWHSWVEINSHVAEEMGLRNGDMVRLASPHGAVEVPVWAYPGIREDTVAIAMGGGHTDFGRFAALAARGSVNAMHLLPAQAEQPSGALILQATRVSVEPTGRRYKLATIEGADTQENRPITPALALSALGHAEDEEHHEGGDHGPHQELQAYGGFVPVEVEGRAEDFPFEGSRYGDYDPEQNARWAMAIDLDKCTGCSACVTACQAENNVAWSGESQVAMGRDLGWIRLERYYETVDATHAGTLDVRHLPMLCQHCGNASCEPVCPVFAAYHTPDGLNGQVYNRCVGTRYCANNCPYKVRVYNWFTYTGEEPVFEGLGHAPEPLNWQFNPDVTIRENGIMEKCSFCVHRIRDVENRARLENRGIREGEVVTACQQSCPAEAIVFGNIRDPQSRVAQVAQNQRSYRVLDELINTQPAVHYLQKVVFHEVEAGEH
jgi:anaerobic selenocysteine-containing dehydrogenase/Fe-S-cluster-containing dehydrogenase component